MRLCCFHLTQYWNRDVSGIGHSLSSVKRLVLPCLLLTLDYVWLRCSVETRSRRCQILSNLAISWQCWQSQSHRILWLWYRSNIELIVYLIIYFNSMTMGATTSLYFSNKMFDPYWWKLFSKSKYKWITRSNKFPIL